MPGLLFIHLTQATIDDDIVNFTLHRWIDIDRVIALRLSCY